jgi:hypothetical protein
MRKEFISRFFLYSYREFHDIGVGMTMRSTDSGLWSQSGFTPDKFWVIFSPLGKMCTYEIGQTGLENMEGGAEQSCDTKRKICTFVNIERTQSMFLSACILACVLPLFFIYYLSLTFFVFYCLSYLKYLFKYIIL